MNQRKSGRVAAAGGSSFLTREVWKAGCKECSCPGAFGIRQLGYEFRKEGVICC